MENTSETQFVFDGLTQVASICKHCGKSSLEDEAALEFDFDRLYKLYRRKGEKKMGIDRCIKLIQTLSDYDNLEKAILNYNLEVKDSLDTYVKRWPTFIGTKSCQPWLDYIEVETKRPVGIVED